MLKLNLQFFAEDVEDDNDDFSGGEDDLATAIQTLLNDNDDSDDDDSDSEDLEDEDSEDDEDDSDEELDDEEELEDDEDLDDEVKDDTTKKVQSKEENAKFAAQRRQQELDRRVQAELERLKQESPEFLLAKQLSEMYGRPAEQIMTEMREAALKKEAADKNLPIELLRERQADQQRMQTLEQELHQLKFQNWQTRIQADGEKLKSEYKMLTQEDIDSATNYMLNVVRNVEMPLEEAIFAVHGKKIVESMANAKIQDDLAQQSGRSKKTPLPVKNGNTSNAKSLSAEERYIAKQFGMTTDDYIKFKS